MDSNGSESIGMRLRRRVQDQPPLRRGMYLERVIATRHDVRDLRDKGYTPEQIGEALREEGLSLSPGTLRNYVALIAAAEKRLEEGGNASPSDAEIKAEVQQIRRERRGRRREKHKSNANDGPRRKPHTGYPTVAWSDDEKL